MTHRESIVVLGNVGWKEYPEAKVLCQNYFIMVQFKSSSFLTFLVNEIPDAAVLLRRDPKSLSRSEPGSITNHIVGGAVSSINQVEFVIYLVV